MEEVLIRRLDKPTKSRAKNGSNLRLVERLKGHTILEEYTAISTGSKGKVSHESTASLIFMVIHYHCQRPELQAARPLASRHPRRGRRHRRPLCTRLNLVTFHGGIHIKKELLTPLDPEACLDSREGNKHEFTPKQSFVT